MALFSGFLRRYHCHQSRSFGFVRCIGPLSLRSRLPHQNVIRGDKEVIIEWNGAKSVFNNMWLRDHCRCPECFHPITRQRLVNTFDLLDQSLQGETWIPHREQ
ncbi:uncharacterized protein EI90DRAFT_2045994 [Cantharellus anzutake]|uniref:uncharacterized protein n=1 Tax=Cantharellus anzutake TaxID=1750568 RepID=UPI0019084200|nr:uncharacterized protein EI90DRAFT_2045994 [Cantharellus anzutake]KAF8340290.1 hypothetical protein EI90DRAFT_2045994 [Cantharellus anzutake]